jgi:hypothetical protein
MSGRRLSEPKGFQRVTAAAALTTLTCQDGPRRYLVADEVGLGKTVVARTVVAEMMKGRRRPLVVFYVASNLNIAHQNRTKLLELLPTEDEQNEAAASADRLTLAANPARRPVHERLHLYTLTPDTSVPLYRRRGGFGRMDERALIFRLLSGRFPSLHNKWFSQKCRGAQAGEQGWRWALRQHEQIDGIRDLQDSFLEANTIAHIAETLPPSRLMGRLRTALAIATLRDVRPDLIIFDEFQKFRELLIDQPKVSPDPVTRALRGGVDRNGPALLLLSATPYRPYSSRQEEAAGFSHHHDFVELIRFLFGSNSTTPAQIESSLREFGTQMLSKEPDWARLGVLRDDIQTRLRPILSRTERPDKSEAPAHAIAAHPHSEIRPEDLRIFKHWVARLQATGMRQRGKFDLMSFAVPYWLSIPLPMQMLGRGYVAWRSADKKHRRREEPALRRSQRDRLDAPKVWPHPQFRELKKLRVLRVWSSHGLHLHCLGGI